MLGNGHYNTYPSINIHGKRYKLTRVMAHVFHGMDLNDPRDVCHHCDNPMCFRPSHLFVGTRSENIQDALGKDLPFGRYPRISSETRKLVLDLHRSGNHSQHAISRRVGITQTSVWRIIHKEQ